MNRVAHLLIALVLCITATAAHAQTRAWLDRDRIALGETATLNVETDANAAPDYAPLLPDFDLSGQASRQQLSWTNGGVSSRSLYAVALRPRRDGLLRIPALRVGGAMTAPLTLLVTAAPAPRAAGSSDVFIQSEADAQEPYVQQSVGWVVRLYSSVPLIAGQLEQPEPAGASLQRIGEDVQYRRTIGSRSYVVTERRYLLIPERSGELVIEPARFDGRGSGNAFDRLFGDGQAELHAVAVPRVLKVRPIPANAPQPWLPLRSLSMRYLGTPGPAQVGNAVEIVVEVMADGATASQLPDVTLPSVDGAQVFPERPQSDESMVDGRPRVRLQRRFSVVPERAGTLVIAGPRVDWWDSRAGAPRTATLPPLTLQVAPGVAPPAAADDAAGEAAPGPIAAHASRRWLGALAAIAGLLIAAGLVWRGRARTTPTRAADAASAVTSPVPPPLPGQYAAYVEPPTSSGAAEMSVAMTSTATAPTGAGAAGTRANAPEQRNPNIDTASLPRLLEFGDLADIEAALRRLCGAGTPELDAVIARLDDPAQRDAVEQLRRARWADGDAATARSRLRATFANGPRWRVPPAPPADALPPLYPRG